jgi:hypothetical protein
MDQLIAYVFLSHKASIFSLNSRIKGSSSSLGNSLQPVQPVHGSPSRLGSQFTMRCVWLGLPNGYKDRSDNHDTPENGKAG